MEQNMMDTIARISGVNPRKCMRCGKCTASCPAFDAMEYHPHQFVSMVENGRIDERQSRGQKSPYGKKDRRVLRLFTSSPEPGDVL